jgi:hypothetical protein
MKLEPCCSRPRRGRAWLPVWTLWAVAVLATPGWTQTTAPEPFSRGAGAAANSWASDYIPAAGSDVVPVSCSTCGDGLLAPGPPPLPAGDGIPCATGCACAQCYPGQVPCDCCCDGDCAFTRFLGGLYRCICCPDPCYLSSWRALANNAFFVDQVKPITQLKLGGDFAGQYAFPDKAEYFWAQENAKGPRYNGPALPAGVKPPGAPNLDYSLGNLYMEGAVNRFSLFVNLSYLNVEPTLYQGAAGFGDMFLGTKSLLLDCELIQFSFQFLTFLPTGNFTRGLGNGHVSLEPSLITAIKLTQRTYLQVQTAYWFPIGGTPTYQGPIFHYHLALNQLLWQCGHDKPVQLIGSAELGGYEIAGGAYTSPVTGLPLSAKDIGTIVNAGPGLRLVVCNKIDIGAGSYFAISKDRMASALARIEFRWRF